MDKIDKALNKLSAKERSVVKSVMAKVKKDEFSTLDISKLAGRDDIYRVRKGQIRIIFLMKKDKSVFILNLERKNDNTYKHF